MAYRKLSGVPAVCGVAMILLALPAQSRACGLFGCFGGCGNQTALRVAYAPAWGAPAACPTQTCNYVPQTSYRTVYRNVPMTTYRAFSACDTCTGRPVTTYRPVTTWAYQPALVPYTTYRLVYSNPCNPCGGYGGYGGVSYGVPAAGCASCGSGTISTPVEPYGGPAEAQPMINGVPQPQTFQENGNPAGIQENPLPAVPSPTGARMKSSPTIISPQTQDRTAWHPVRPATYYQPVALPVPPTPPYATGVWRAASP
ncbi:MAG TPA: hypothetical protein VMY42_19295 [Thermoguttaceae bacterium]|nr:hypothetical protein [Thermoguttaceae bacterium]